MFRNVDRHLVILAVVISVCLTAVTVWAVARQGLALQGREWADLRNAAERAAAERSTRWQADLERAFEAAAAAYASAGRDGLDRWVEQQHRWCFVAVATAAGQPSVFPITAMQEPLPSQQPDGEPILYDPAFTAEEARSALERFTRLADSDESLVRAPALLAAADCHRQLGDLSAAAGCYAQAAETLRHRPALARYAFEADLEYIACLSALGQTADARGRLQSLLDEMAGAHPARYSPAEIELLRRRGETLLSEPDGAELRVQLDGLAARAEIRAALPTVTDTLSRVCATPPAAAESGTELHTLRPEVGGVLVLAVRRSPAGACLALTATLADLLDRYWGAAADDGWRLVVDCNLSDAELLCRLGPGFGDAVLEPSAAVREQMRAHSHRRAVFVVVTGAGTVGAWAVLIWLLFRAMARQRELVRLQRRFVADVSHELKTPLAMIRLLAETLQDGRISDQQRVQAYYGTITREAERLSVLLDSILDFSRIESGRQQYEFKDCDIADVARQAWTLFEPEFASAGFERKLEIAPELPVVRADPAAVQQVIVNLLQNAFRYGGDGKYVRLAVARDGYLIVVTVEDHGIGMTRAQLERLGDTFFRAEDTRVRQTRGSGLGLAIINHIVRAHGGKVEVHSQPNKGSTFTVWFPFEPNFK